MFKKSLVLISIILVVLLIAWIIFTTILQNTNMTNIESYYSCDQRELDAVPFKVDFDYVEQNITGNIFYLSSKSGMDAVFYNVYSSNGELVESTDHYLDIDQLDTRLVNCSEVTESEFNQIF